MKILILSSGVTGVFQAGSPHVENLYRDFPDCEFRIIPGGSETQEDILWADAVTGHPKPELLKAATGLKWLHIQSAGVNNYTEREIYGNPNIIVTRTADVFSVAMAEHAVGMLLALNRDFAHYIRNSTAHKWQRGSSKYELLGATVLMLGTGSIAAEVVKRLCGFGCKITGVRRDISKPAEGYEKVYPTEKLHDALKEADYIVSSLPLTAATENYLGPAEFAVMKERAILVNVGRGRTIDQKALIDALAAGKIAGAGLDVTEPEPLNADSPLWDMENVIITPHSSGSSLNTETRRMECFTGLLRKFLGGESMDYLLDFEAGY